MVSSCSSFFSYYRALYISFCWGRAGRLLTSWLEIGKRDDRSEKYKNSLEKVICSLYYEDGFFSYEILAKKTKKSGPWMEEERAGVGDGVEITRKHGESKTFPPCDLRTFLLYKRLFLFQPWYHWNGERISLKKKTFDLLERRNVLATEEGSAKVGMKRGRRQAIVQLVLR